MTHGRSGSRRAWRGRHSDRGGRLRRVRGTPVRLHPGLRTPPAATMIARASGRRCLPARRTPQHPRNTPSQWTTCAHPGREEHDRHAVPTVERSPWPRCAQGVATCPRRCRTSRSGCSLCRDRTPAPLSPGSSRRAPGTAPAIPCMPESEWPRGKASCAPPSPTCTATGPRRCSPTPRRQPNSPGRTARKHGLRRRTSGRCGRSWRHAGVATSRRFTAGRSRTGCHWRNRRETAACPARQVGCGERRSKAGPGRRSRREPAGHAAGSVV